MDAAFGVVARGLRLAAFGYLLTCWSAGSAAALLWLLSESGYYQNELRVMLLVLIWAMVGAGVLGVVIGFVGRVQCMRMPEEYPAVRGRAIVTIVLEGSGWASLFVGVGILIAMGYKWLPQVFWIPPIGMGLAGLMILGGRIMFLRFLRQLATVVDDNASGRRAKWSLTIFLGSWAAALFGVGVAAAFGVLGFSEFSQVAAYLIWILAGMTGAVGLIVYDRLLNNLVRSVTAFAHEHDGEERERYEEQRRLCDEDDEEDADSDRSREQAQ